MNNMDKNNPIKNGIDQRIQDAIVEYVEQHEEAPDFEHVFTRARKQRQNRNLFRAGMWTTAAAAVILMALLLFPAQDELTVGEALGLYDWEAPTDQLLYSEDLWLSVDEDPQNINEPSNLD